MNTRCKISFAYVLVWMILGCVVSSNGRPSDINDSGLTRLPIAPRINEDNEPVSPPDPNTVAGDKSAGNVKNLVVPQIGYLEETSDVNNIGKDPLPVIVSSPNPSGMGQPADGAGTTGNGILVPIVSVMDDDSSKSTSIMNHPLVALLPASTSQDSDSQLPDISSLPVIQAEPAKPEIRRSVIESRANGRDDKSSEIMDVAEDIVFRPLFAIRQSAGQSPYTSRNLRRNHRPNYRRYNVNGYYRIPSNNYYRSNNRDGEDFSDE